MLKAEGRMQNEVFSSKNPVSLVKCVSPDYLTQGKAADV